MGTIIFNDNEKEKVEVAEGESIKPCCEEAGIPFACEEGLCGTCVIEVEEGMENLSEFTQEESDFLGDQGCERLACQCKMKGSGRVKVKF